MPTIILHFQIFYQASILVPVYSKMPNAKQSALETPMLEIKIMLDQVFWQNVHVKVKIVFGLLEKQSNQIYSALVSIAGHFWPHGHFLTIHFHDRPFWIVRFLPRLLTLNQDRSLLSKAVQFWPINFYSAGPSSLTFTSTQFLTFDFNFF